MLNKIIISFDKQTHFIVSLVLFGLFFIVGFIIAPSFNNNLIVWVAIYFIIAYFKLNGQNFCSSNKINITLVLLGISGIISLTVITYFLGVKISFFNNVSMYRWASANSPLFLFIAFGSLNLFNKSKFTNRFINYISSLSFLIYVIHENLLFRCYIRPQIWNYIYTSFGYNLLFVWIGIFTIVLFLLATLISTLYNVSLQKLVHKVSDKIYTLLAKLIHWCQTTLITLIN